MHGTGFACAEDGKAEATLELTQTSFAFLIGYTSLALSLVQATASGEVFNLSKLEDFNGMYMSASVEGTFGAGAGAATMRNEKGVVIHLFTTTQGLNLKIAPEGMRLSLK